MAKRGYHHGDLPRAMVREAVRTIQRHGVEGLTIRGVGDTLGVSRTALYRHFANKDALLAAVAGEGFRTLREALLSAWNEGGGGRAGFDAMGLAYVRFALAHPSHYKVMFGGFFTPTKPVDAEQARSIDAYGALVDAIVDLQRAGLLVADDPQMLAPYIWALVHGIAMLALDGLVANREAIERLTLFALERVWSGIAPAR